MLKCRYVDTSTVTTDDDGLVVVVAAAFAPLLCCMLAPDAGLELPAGVAPAPAPPPTTPLPAALVSGSVLLLLERDDGNRDGGNTLTESGTSISSADADDTVCCELLRCWCW